MFPTSDPLRNEPQLPAPPFIAPHAARFFNFRGDTKNFDADAVALSQATLEEYRKTYSADEHYPLRLTIAPHTGLPAQLNGFFAANVPFVGSEDVIETAQRWLQESVVSRALYGLEWDQVAARKLLQFDRVRRLQNTESQWSAHVHFQQMYSELPVYGGEVVCHMTTDTRRNAVSSSYFPIKVDSPLANPPNEKDAAARAVQTARAVLLDTLAPIDALDLYWDELAEWLQEIPPSRAWDAHDAARLERVVKGLSARGIEFDLDALPKVFSEWHSAQVAQALRELARKSRRGPAQLAVTPYANRQVFVFPFAGIFCHACRVEYVPSVGTPWRLFVEAQSGAPLGEPEALALWAQIYAASADVPGHPNNPLGSPQNFVFTAAEENVLRGFARVFDRNCNAVSIGRASDEIANVCHHTKAMRDFFVGLANPNAPVIVDSYVNSAHATIAPGLEMNVSLERTGLQMGFLFFDRAVPPPSVELELGAPSTARLDPCVGRADPADAGNAALRRERKLLQFQTDPGGAGLATEDGRLVFTPSLDPEVIYHEVAHACMWLVNRSPFEQSNVNVPFWRALTEGYADYFARSFAARSETAAARNANPNNCWAAAAFRNFGDERALSRRTTVPGEDVLALPNLYPEEQVAGAGMYRVGMIWARALWDIRTFFATPRNAAGNPCAANGAFSQMGAADVDRWALHAFDHMVGWVTNFETAAEAFINEAQRTGQATACEIEQIKNIFVARGIYAERGMQAVARANNVIVVGADAGVRRFVENAALPWSNPALSGVIALAFSDPNVNPITLYAATENGIFRHTDFPNNTWQPVGAWLAGETPVSMMLDSNVLFVGTAHGIYFFNPNNSQWETWNPPQGPRNPFNGIAFGMTIGQVRANDNHLYRACFVADLSGPKSRFERGVKLNILTQTPPAGSPQPFQGPLHAAPTRNGWVNLLPVGTPGDAASAQRALSARPTAVTFAIPVADPNPQTRRTNLYVGTLQHGVWCQENIVHRINSAFMQSNLVEMPNNLAVGIAVLCLVCDQLGSHNRLLAGTNDGVFEHNLNAPNSGWQRLAGIPSNTIVRYIAPTPGQPLLATYNQGLLFHNGAFWQSFKLE